MHQKLHQRPIQDSQNEYSDGFGCQNGSQNGAFSTLDLRLQTMRFCCYLLYFGALGRFWVVRKLLRKDIAQFRLQKALNGLQTQKGLKMESKSDPQQIIVLMFFWSFEPRLSKSTPNPSWECFWHVFGSIFDWQMCWKWLTQMSWTRGENLRWMA